MFSWILLVWYIYQYHHLILHNYFQKYNSCFALFWLLCPLPKLRTRTIINIFVTFGNKIQLKIRSEREFHRSHRPLWMTSSGPMIYTKYKIIDHDDVIKWKHFPCYWPFVRGIHRSPVNSPHKGQWRGALMFSLICAWINACVNNRQAGDLRHHRAHFDVTVMWEVDICRGSYDKFGSKLYTGLAVDGLKYRTLSKCLVFRTCALKITSKHIMNGPWIGLLLPLELCSRISTIS